MRFKKFKLFSQLFAAVMPLAQLYSWVFPLFVAAYLNPLYRSCININTLGEADIEMATFIVTLPILVYGTYLNFKLIKQFYLKEIRYDVLG